jgi:hypothetical protein
MAASPSPISGASPERSAHVKDPETCRMYEVPVGDWDGTIGGYRNHVRPTEILHHSEDLIIAGERNVTDSKVDV